MSDERRERYAAAIAQAMAPDIWPMDCYVEADAAMAVADDENAHLRAELTDAHTMATVIRKDLETERDETARLRAENDTANKIAWQNHGHMVRLSATIERVRDVLEERYDHRGIDDLANSIVGVLEEGGRE